MDQAKYFEIVIRHRKPAHPDQTKPVCKNDKRHEGTTEIKTGARIDNIAFIRKDSSQVMPDGIVFNVDGLTPHVQVKGARRTKSAVYE